MKVKDKKVSTTGRKTSIKLRLLIIPLIVVMLSVLAMNTVSNTMIRKTLVTRMNDNGRFIMKEFVNRIEDNKTSLEITTNSIESDIRNIGNYVFSIGDEISNEKMIEIAKNFQVDEINYFGPTGEILFSSMSGNLGDKLPDTHPIRILQNSSDKEVIENIRKHTTTETYYKYGAIKGRGNAVVQAGFIADTINKLTEQFSYQRLVEELAAEEEVIYAVFIDENLIAAANSSTDLIGMDLSKMKMF